MVTLNVNGQKVQIEPTDDTRLLFFLREELGLTGTKYGCGVASCGACTVLVNGEAAYACQLQVGELDQVDITTIEGLSEDASHPLQKAWISEQVPQCGYCQSGQIMRAAALLSSNPQPSRNEIRDHMSANLCRCGTYNSIFRAIEQVAKGKK